MDRNTVKCFGKVKGSYNCSRGGLFLIKTIGYGGGNVE